MYNNNSFLPKAEASKIQTPGIYSGLVLDSVEVTDKMTKIKFSDENNLDFCDVALFPTIDAERVKTFVEADFRKKGQVASGPDFKKACELQYSKSETQVLTKANEICIAVAGAEKTVALTGKNYSSLFENIIALIKANIGKKVNVKLTRDYKGEWCELNSKRLGNIEAYVPGQTPTLKYTSWELDQSMDKPISKIGNSASYTTPAANTNPFGPSTTEEFTKGGSDMVSTNPFAQVDDKDMIADDKLPW